MKTIEQNNEEARARWFPSKQNCNQTGVECRNCKGVELLLVNPGWICDSIPPSIQVECPQCKKTEFILM